MSFRTGRFPDRRAPLGEPAGIRVILVRHGQTSYNVEKRIQGHADINLDARGEEQAEKLAVILRKREKIDAIYSSDLKRALHTAEFIAGDDLDVIQATGFRERSMGPLEGMLHSEAIAKRNKDGMPSLLSYGEKQNELSERLANAYRATIEEAKAKNYKTIAIVSHGSALYHLIGELKKNILRPANGRLFANYEAEKRSRMGVKLGNCSVCIINDKDQFEVFGEQWVESIVRERDLV